MATVLLIDDQDSVLNFLDALLKRDGYRLLTAQDADSALRILREESVDVVLADYVMKPLNGIEILRAMKKEQIGAAFILLSGFLTVEVAIEAMKEGAYDCLTKPLELNELRAAVTRALRAQGSLPQETANLSKWRVSPRFGAIVTRTPAMQRICALMEQVALADAPVLVQGELGTGRNLVAQTIHQLSRRKAKPFVAVDCSGAAVATDLGVGAPDPARSSAFARAHGGTLLLDHIEHLDPALQDLVASALKDKRVAFGDERIDVDVRFLASTSRSIQALSNSAGLREDLYRKLAVLPLEVPPLRERTADIMPLVLYFFEQGQGSRQALPDVEPAAEAVLEAYHWPGNVGELRTVTTEVRDRLAGDTLTADLLPGAICERVGATDSREDVVVKEAERGRSLKAFLKSKEQEFLSIVMNSSENDLEKAALSLGMDPDSLRRRIVEKESSSA